LTFAQNCQNKFSFIYGVDYIDQIDYNEDVNNNSTLKNE